MALNTFQILVYNKLKKIGPKAIYLLSNYAISEKISVSSIRETAIRELSDLVNQCIELKILSRIKEQFAFNIVANAYDEAERIIESSLNQGIVTISQADSIFPDSLRNIVSSETDKKGNQKLNAPVVLYVKGNLQSLSTPKGIAIIGTREPTKAGIQAGLYFSERFAKSGFNIISGLAIGCDTTAHKGALSANGITTAFLAHGLDLPVYPKENQSLANEILANDGLLISEYEIGTPLLANRLVERDRLQSGMADATLAIQTGITGGTLHAINATLANKKPLYMVQYRGNTLQSEKVQGNVKFITERLATPLSRANLDDVIGSLTSAKANNGKSEKRNIQKSLFDL